MLESGNLRIPAARPASREPKHGFVPSPALAPQGLQRAATMPLLALPGALTGAGWLRGMSEEMSFG